MKSDSLVEERLLVQIDLEVYVGEAEALRQLFLDIFS